MLRRFSLLLFRRTFLFFLLLVVGCSAQGPSIELNRRIERQVRTTFSVPGSVKVEIGARKASTEFPNYDSIEITFVQGERRQKQDFLVAKDGSTLLRLTRLDLRKDPYAELMQKIDLRGRPTRGAQNAKVTIVNYDDFQCPFCASMFKALHEVMSTYGDRVKLVAKDFPLEQIHPWATHAAIDANCLLSQSTGDGTSAYWDYSSYVHANQKEITTGQKAESKDAPAPGSTADKAAVTAPQKSTLKDQQDRLDRLVIDYGQKYNLEAAALKACVQAQSDSAIRASLKEGLGVGVEATPTLYINGEKMDGAATVAELTAMIDRALRDADAMAAPAPAAGNSGPADKKAR